MSLWPFRPVGEVVEVLEWRTDVLRARAGEQRHRLRERPRRQWHFNHEFTAEEQSAARAIVRGASSFLVMDWVRVVYVGAVTAGSSVSLAMATAGYGLAAGQSVVLWNGMTDYEVCTVESVAPAALVLAFVATPRAATRIYRLDVAHLAVELSITRPTGPTQYASISFESPGVDVPAATAYAQYRGHDVLPMVPVAGGGLPESLNWPIEVFDNETGRVSTTRGRDLVDDKFMMRWLYRAAEDAEIQALRAWVASRCGRWLAFWESSWQKDLVAAADIGAAATVLRVFAPAGVSSLGRSTFDLEIVAGGNVWYRRVTAVSAGPAVGGRPTFDLTLDSALGVAVSTAAFGRISFLRCARFAADRIELLHRPGEGLSVAVPCIEVPVP